MAKSRISNKEFRIALIQNDIPSVSALAQEMEVHPIRIYELDYEIGLHWPSKQRLMERIAERLGYDDPGELFPAYQGDRAKGVA